MKISLSRPLSTDRLRWLRCGLTALLFIGVAGCSFNAKLEADPRLAHFAGSSPAPGMPAPELSATDLHGLPVSLDDLLDGRPLVLQLGSASCPVFRYRRFGMESLIEDFGERVRFVVIYTVEAHPVGSPSVYADDKEWDPWINRLAGSRIEAARDFEGRLAEARRVMRHLELRQEVLVDTFDDATWRAYGKAPSAAFVLDRDGQVIARQKWVRPNLLRDVLSGIGLDDVDRQRAEEGGKGLETGGI